MRDFIPLFNEVYDAVLQVCDEGFSQGDLKKYSSEREIIDECIELAVYDERNKDFNEKDSVKVNAARYVNNGQWFNVNVLNKVKQHFLYLGKISGTSYEMQSDILQTISDCIGAGIYFEQDQILTVLMEALKLYTYRKDASHRFQHASLNLEQKQRVRCAQDLIRAGYTVQVVEGEFELPDESERLFCAHIENLIKDIGGLTFIQMLFDKELSSRYDKKMDRYVITRDKKTAFGNETPELRTPYNYLIQLGLKNLCYKNNVLAQNNCTQKYESILNLSRCYMEIQNLQGYGAMEDLLICYADLPATLARNMLFEKICVPRQYHPDFVLFLMRNLLAVKCEDLPEKDKICSYDDFEAIMDYILKNADGPRIFTLDELSDVFREGKTKLAILLSWLSLDAKGVNPEFQHYLDKTNTWTKPLIKISDNEYFCLNADMSGFGFYEAIHQKLRDVFGVELDGNLGGELENAIHKLFSDYGIIYHHGRYNEYKNIHGGECDMVIETDDKIAFIEIKKIPLPESYEEGDDVKTLSVLSAGMLSAQEQILKHKLHLKSQQYIDLIDDSDGSVYRLDNSAGKTILSISLCMPEYDFLVNRAFTRNFLESILFVTYHAVDPDRENILNGLNERIESIRKLSTQLFDGQHFTTNDLFFGASFMTLQQVWYALQMFPDADSFLEYVTQSQCIVTGSGSVYVDMMQYKSLQKASEQTI